MKTTARSFVDSGWIQSHARHGQNSRFMTPRTLPVTPRKSAQPRTVARLPLVMSPDSAESCSKFGTNPKVLTRLDRGIPQLPARIPFPSYCFDTAHSHRSNCRRSTLENRFFKAGRSAQWLNLQPTIRKQHSIRKRPSMPATSPFRIAPSTWGRWLQRFPEWGSLPGC